MTEYIGEYGEMSVRLKDSNASGKINLGLQTSFYSHRSGWDYVVHNMSDFNNPNGINFDGSPSDFPFTPYEIGDQT